MKRKRYHSSPERIASGLDRGASDPPHAAEPANAWKRPIHAPLVMAVLLVFSACGHSPRTENDAHDGVVAAIADLAVSEDHFRTAFKEAYHRTGQVLGPDPATRKAVLDAEFDTYVMAVHARDLGLADSDEAQRRLAAIQRRVITEEVRDRIVVSGVKVEESDLRDYFVRFNTRIRASHLYARDEQGILKFQERLARGEAFEDLAREAFTNERLASSGGDLGWFTTDELDAAFEEAAFGLRNGEVSGPVQTAQGYSIIRVTDRRTVPVLTEADFNRQRDRLADYVLKKKHELAARAHMQEFLDAVEFDPSGFEPAWQAITNRLSELHRLDSELLSAIRTDVGTLLSHPMGGFSGDDFVRELLASLPGQVNAIRDLESFRDVVLGLAYRQHLMQLAADAGLAEQPNVLDSIQETWLHHLESLAMEQLRMQVRADVTPADLYEEYSRDPSLYHEPVQLDLQRVVLADRETAETVRELALGGEDFTRLVRTYSRNAEDVLLDGRLGIQSVRAYGMNGPALALLPVGGISEVVAYHQAEYHVYKSLGRIEDRALTFQEAKEQVEEILVRKRVRDLRTETLDAVKKRHNAYIDLDRLQTLELRI